MSVAMAGDRIIPAHAGSTASSSVASGLPQDHPRSRGEHKAVTPSWPAKAGSSPLTRGARRAEVVHQLRNGIIPAHAGSTR